MQDNEGFPLAPPALPLADAPIHVAEGASLADRLAKAENANRWLRWLLGFLCACCLAFLAAAYAIMGELQRDRARIVAETRRAQVSAASLAVINGALSQAVERQGETVRAQASQLRVAICRARNDVLLSECLDRDDAIADPVRVRTCVVAWVGSAPCASPSSP